MKRITDSLSNVESEVIMLREKNIGHCGGCLFCHDKKGCAIKDDMDLIYKKLIEADLIILATPNYFDNVSGLLKDFMDRTNAIYQTESLKNKKLINIVVGGGSKENSERVSKGAMGYFAETHGMKIISDYIFKGLNPGEVLNDEEFEKNVGKIVGDIKNLSK